jgi:hypothetical protein
MIRTRLIRSRLEFVAVLLRGIDICRFLGPTNLKSTVGQYSRTDHMNTVMVASLTLTD